LKDRSTLVEQASRARELAAEIAADLAARVASSSSSRPDPLFRTGQSVHHYWASWFPGCGPGQNPQIKKKFRPSWFSAEVSSSPEWKTDQPYAGTLHTGWSYLVY
jgi:hypothetical protein